MLGHSLRKTIPINCALHKQIAFDAQIEIKLLVWSADKNLRQFGRTERTRTLDHQASARQQGPAEFPNVGIGTFRTCRNVRLESAMRCTADMDRALCSGPVCVYPAKKARSD
jgi:hypothetical protein